MKRPRRLPPVLLHIEAPVDATFDEPPLALLPVPQAAAEWRRLAPILRTRRQITEADRSALMALCLEWDRYLTAGVKAKPEIIKDPRNRAVPNPYLAIQTAALAECRSLWTELGLTPQARSAGRPPDLPETADEVAPSTTWTPDRDRIDAEAMADRRRRVLALRLLRKTEPAIARELGVSIPTVSRDLRWIRTHWRDAYGVRPDVEPGELIGEAIAVYQDVELHALEDAAALRLDRDAAGTDLVAYAHARMTCLRAALTARHAQVELLQDLGVIERALGRIEIGVIPNASQLRIALAAIKPAELVEAPPPAPLG